MAVEMCHEPPGAHTATVVAPLKVAVATDYEPAATSTLRANFDSVVLDGDIRDVSTKDLLDAGGMGVGEATLVVGGPPCTPFSKSGFWLDYKPESRDPEASLLDDFVRVVREAQPEAFILENVQGLTYRTHAKQFARLLSCSSSIKPVTRPGSRS